MAFPPGFGAFNLVSGSLENTIGIPFWDGYSAFSATVIRGSAEGALFSYNGWDRVVLAQETLPGLCKARARPEIGIDRKPAPGRDGETLTVKGYRPCEIEIESMIWTPEQWLKWQEIIPSIWRRPNPGSVLSARNAVGIAYPPFTFAGISQVVIVGLEPPQRGSIPQSMVIKLKALEFVPPGAVNNSTVISRPAGPPIDPRFASLNNAPPPPSAGGNGLAGASPSTLGGSN